MNTQITTEVISVTPEMAKEWLEKYGNPKNRNVSESVIINYSRIMRKGMWRLNGEALVFEADGMLANGHHRLAATIKAGVAVSFLVVRGVSEDAFATYDCGNRRKAGHVFQMSDIPNANGVASIVSQSIMYRASLARKGSYNTYVRPTTEECLDEYNLHPSLYSFAERKSALATGLIKRSTPGMVFAYAMIDKGHSKSTVENFAVQLAKGEMLKADDPIYLLRNALIRMKTEKLKGKGVSTNYQKSLFIKAWNAHISKQRLKILKVVDPNKAVEIL